MDKLGETVDIVLKSASKESGCTPEEIHHYRRDCMAYDREADAAKAELLKLLNFMPSPGTEQDPKTRAVLYWDILKTELSPGNIAAVCRSAMRGNVGDSRFMPTPPQMIAYGRQWFQRRDPVRLDPRIAGPRAKPALVTYAAPEHKHLPAGNYRETGARADDCKRLADKIRREISAENDRLRALDNPMPVIHNPVIGRRELAEMDEGEREKHRTEAEAYLEKLKSLPMPKLSPEAINRYLSNHNPEPV